MITVYLAHYPSCPTHEKYKTEHALGLKLLLEGLFELYQKEMSVESLEGGALALNAYGKPYLKEEPRIHFNISHCDGLVGCAFCETEVGLDLERLGKFNPVIFRKVLTPSEKDFMASLEADSCRFQEMFFRFWTLKESRIKQAGMGLSMSMTDFSFEIDDATEPPKLSCSEDGLKFFQQWADAGYLMSVCTGQTQEGADAVKLVWKSY